MCIFLLGFVLQLAGEEKKALQCIEKGNFTEIVLRGQWQMQLIYDMEENKDIHLLQKALKQLLVYRTSQ